MQEHEEHAEWKSLLTTIVHFIRILLLMLIIRIILVISYYSLLLLLLYVYHNCCLLFLRLPAVRLLFDSGLPALPAAGSMLGNAGSHSSGTGFLLRAGGKGGTFVSFRCLPALACEMLHLLLMRGKYGKAF